MLWPRLITPFFLFSATLILLFVSLSLPIIKTIYLLEIAAKTKPNVPTSVGTSIRFGLWGYCVGALSFANGKTRFDSTAECSKIRVGFSLNQGLLQLIPVGDNTDLVDAILKTLTVVLVLHPIAGFLALLCFIAALAQALRPMIPHAIPICTLLISIIPAVATTVVFVIDIVLVVVARAKVEEATNNGLTVNWGNAVWMTAGSIVAMWLSVIGLSAVACGCFGYGRIGYMMRKKRRTPPNEKEDQSPDFYVPGKVPDGILMRPSTPT